MRNLLITVMLLIVVTLMFTAIITDSTTGVKEPIQTKGQEANTSISGLDAE